MAKLQPSDIVRKGNELMESKYRLGLMEQKLILTVAAKISKNDSYDKTYIIGIKEFCDLIGLKGNSAYSELRKLTLKLRGNAFEVRIGDRIIQTTWLTKVVYKEREGYMELGIDEELKEFFFELKKNFTSYELQNVVRLKRSFSIRMYELLKRYSFRGEKVFEVNELKEILGVEDTYALYADFKRRAILDTQKELRVKTDIDFTFEEIKTGRKVTSIRFFIKSKVEELSSPNIEPETAVIEEINQQINKFGLFVKKEIVEFWSKYGTYKVTELLRYAVNSRSVHNPIGFVTWAIQNNFTASVFETTKGRKEIVPLWLQKQKEEENAYSLWRQEEFSLLSNLGEQEIDLEEERRRLEEELKMYKNHFNAYD